MALMTSSLAAPHSIDEYFIIEIIGATNVPKVDHFSESDPFITVQALRDGHPIGNVCV